MTLPPRSLTVLGVDPGYARCGLAVVDQYGPQVRRLRSWETIVTPPTAPISLRLWTVWSRIRELAGVISSDRQHLVVLAYEEQDGAQEGHRKRGTTSAEATQVREVVGLIRGIGWELGLPIEPVTPQAARAALGLPAGADKVQIARALAALLQAPAGKAPSHSTDAAAMAVAAAARQATRNSTSGVPVR